MTDSTAQPAGRQMAAFPNTLPLVAAAAAALIASASHGVAQDNPDEDVAFHLVGQVVDITTGAAVSGARVSVAASEWMSVTNREGRFILPGLDPGIHTLTVEQLGYRTLVVQAQAARETPPLQLGMQLDPVVLEGLEVVVRRFERRRRATGLRVTEYDRQDLAASTNTSVAEMLEQRIPVQRARCSGGGFECIAARGASFRPVVCIDETPMIDAWNALAAYSPQEFYMIEVYGRGGLVRAYTHNFMERAARIRFLPATVGSC